MTEQARYEVRRFVGAGARGGERVYWQVWDTLAYPFDGEVSRWNTKAEAEAECDLWNEAVPQ